MKDKTNFDVIIVGGSYAGLAAGMALGRALKNVLIIDSALPCNRQTPHSHNFLTHDGKTPGEIAALARHQVLKYDTVRIMDGLATAGASTKHGFLINTSNGMSFSAKKLIFATGIKDIMPDLEGFAACWGISVLHCPYCHGYEIRNKPTGILGNGDQAFELAMLISNWSQQLTVFTNSPAVFTPEQADTLNRHSIQIVEKEIKSLEHIHGRLQRVVFKDGSAASPEAVYARAAFEQHSNIPSALGCALTDDGYISTDGTQKTSVPGIFACGDNTTRMRTVANAVAMGTTAGMSVNKELVLEKFQLVL